MNTLEQRTMETPTLEQETIVERNLLSAGLDYYKLTMSQLAFEQEPDTEVTFTFKNRGEQRLLDHIDPELLQQRFDFLQANGFQENELTAFAAITNTHGERVFSDEYLDYLRTTELPEVVITHDEAIDDLAITTTGAWPMVTFWETVVMSEVNEAYFEGYLLDNGLNPMDVYDEGDRRLSEKIAVLQANPDIKFSDFGTRRHLSQKWQKHVIERLLRECPENFVGTSNVAFSNTFDKQPVGTFAHEMPMVYAGLAQARGHDIRSSHRAFLEAWATRYPDLTIALTDTFGSEFFFEDFTAEQAQTWLGQRHDSGDPFDFGDRAITFYEDLAIDPLTKKIVFSDGLNLKTIVELRDYFKDRVGYTFGWGTTLTNDLGLKPLNVVMKATHVKTADGHEADTVKLSDNPGKHTGPPELVAEYERIF